MQTYFIVYPSTNISDEETFIRDFLVILKRTLQNYKKISKKCFLITTWTVMLSTGSNVEFHTGVYPVAKVFLNANHINTNLGPVCAI